MILVLIGANGACTQCNPEWEKLRAHDALMDSRISQHNLACLVFCGCFQDDDPER